MTFYAIQFDSSSYNNFIVLFPYFLLFLTVFFTIHIEIEHARLKIALTIPAGAPVTVGNVLIEMLPVVTDKTINYLSK